MNSRFPLGTCLQHSWLVDEASTVRARGTVNLDVLATPQMIFMMEDTCVFAIAGLLEEGELTVGTSVHIDHFASARLGETVDVLAELVSVRRRRLVFRVEARAGRLVIGRGLHERAVITVEA